MKYVIVRAIEENNKTIINVAFPILAILLTCQMAIIGFCQGNLDSGLVAYYPFNGNADDSIGSNHGYVAGALQTTDRFGIPGRAYQFDGLDDYIRIPTSTAINFNALSESYSISLWINSLDPNLTHSESRIIDKSDLISGLQTTPPYPYLWMIHGFTGYAYSKIFDFNCVPTACFGNVWDGNWHLLTSICEHSENRVVVFVDGIAVDTALFFFYNPTTNSDDLIVGNNEDNDMPFHGCIDDIRMYNRALTANEVLSLYGSGAGITELQNIEMNIYPNPAQSSLHLELPISHGMTKIRVIDLSGRIRICDIVPPSISNAVIPIEDLTQGVYLLEAWTGDGNLHSGMFIKE